MKTCLGSGRVRIASRKVAGQYEQSAIDAGNQEEMLLLRLGMVRVRAKPAGAVPPTVSDRQLQVVPPRVLPGAGVASPPSSEAPTSEDMVTALTLLMYRDSSAALLLDLRRGIKAVMDMLDASIRDGFSLARSVELAAQWDEILRVGPVSPIALEDFHLAKSGGLGECRRAAEDLHFRLSDFIHGVVVHRRDEANRGWRNWLREDPLVHPYRWRPGLTWCLLLPFLQCEPHLTHGGSGSC